jgi:hypothetical protein
MLRFIAMCQCMVSGTFWVLDWGVVAGTIWIWADWIVGYHSWNPVLLLMQMYNPSILWWRAMSSLAFAMLIGSVYVYFNVQYLAEMEALVVWLLGYDFLCMNITIQEQLSPKLDLVLKLQLLTLHNPWDPSHLLTFTFVPLKGASHYCLLLGCQSSSSGIMY